MILVIVTEIFSAAKPMFGQTEASSQTAMSPEAEAYLQTAIDLFKHQHINRDQVDWPSVTEKARALAHDAKTPADTYPAIRLIIHELGEKHTFFMTPDQVKASQTGKQSGAVAPPQLNLPEGELLAEGPGVIRLQGFGGSATEGKAYASSTQHALARMERDGACGWIVDLRFNSGGNMWPMLNGLSGLFDDGVLGSFDNTAGGNTKWLRQKGAIFVDSPGEHSPEPDFEGLHNSGAPVAVLLSKVTVSSGEFTAMAFEGRPATRFFGQTTGGYVTANAPMPMPDGAQIAMTNGWGRDRTGKRYATALVPDEQTDGGQPTLDAALKWLKSQGCSRLLHSGKQ